MTEKERVIKSLKETAVFILVADIFILFAAKILGLA